MKSRPTASLSKRRLTAIREEVTVAHNDFEHALLKRALYKTNNTETSQDLVQTTFLKTLVYLQKGGKIDLMRSFLNHVLNGLVIDEYRKHKIASLDVLLENGLVLGTSEHEREMDVLDGKQLILLINQLPRKYEVIMRLRYLKGLSHKDISLITNQTKNTVAVQVHRGVAKLRKLSLIPLSKLVKPSSGVRPCTVLA